MQQIPLNENNNFYKPFYLVYQHNQKQSPDIIIYKLNIVWKQKMSSSSQVVGFETDNNGKLLKLHIKDISKTKGIPKTKGISKTKRKWRPSLDTIHENIEEHENVGGWRRRKTRRKKY